jgi:hypothetical protein
MAAGSAEEVPDDAVLAWRPSWDTCVAVFREGGKLIKSSVENPLVAKVTVMMAACDKWVTRAQRLIAANKSSQDVIRSITPPNKPEVASDAATLLFDVMKLPVDVKEKDSYLPGDPAALLAELRTLL